MESPQPIVLDKIRKLSFEPRFSSLAAPLAMQSYLVDVLIISNSSATMFFIVLRRDTSGEGTQSFPVCESIPCDSIRRNEAPSLSDARPFGMAAFRSEEV